MTAAQAQVVKGRWFILAMLVLATAINLMDRQLPFIMAQPIKEEFRLSDTQIGLLGGVAFSLVYALAALPLARLADRLSRRNVLAGCLMVWSAFTALGGLAKSFPFLMFTRAGVAIGEAGAAPASHSMISDLFDERRRGLALSINTAGIAIGVLLGMAIGGYLLEFLEWRTVLMLAAVPGGVLGLAFLLFVKEPMRTGHGLRASAKDAAVDKAPSMGVALMTLWRQRSFVWLTIAATLAGFGTAGGAAFGPSFYMRVHGLSVGEAGLLFGLILGLGGAVGGIIWGAIADWLAIRDKRWILWVPALGTLVKLPLYCASWIVADFTLAIALQAVAWIMGSSYLSMSYTATQSVAAPRLRAFASATMQLVFNIVGNVAGPIFVGFLSDRLATDSQAGELGLALSFAGLALLLSSLAFFRAAHFLRQDIAVSQATP